MAAYKYTQALEHAAVPAFGSFGFNETSLLDLACLPCLPYLLNLCVQRAYSIVRLVQSCAIVLYLHRQLHRQLVLRRRITSNTPFFCTHKSEGRTLFIDDSLHRRLVYMGTRVGLLCGNPCSLYSCGCRYHKDHIYMLVLVPLRVFTLWLTKRRKDDQRSFSNIIIIVAPCNDAV